MTPTKPKSNAGRKAQTLEGGEAAALQFLQRQMRSLESDLSQTRDAFGLALIRLHEDRGYEFAAMARACGISHQRMSQLYYRAREAETSKQLERAANLALPS